MSDIGPTPEERTKQLNTIVLPSYTIHSWKWFWWGFILGVGVGGGAVYSSQWWLPLVEGLTR
jgi:hypothetical protein